MKLNRTSLVAVVGGGLVAGSLVLAGPAAASSGGGHGEAGGPSDAGHATSQVSAVPTQASNQVRAELPLAPIGDTAPSGTAGSGAVPMTGDLNVGGKDAQRNN